MIPPNYIRQNDGSYSHPSRNYGENIQSGRAGTVAVVEPNSSDAALAPAQVQTSTGPRFLVRVKAFRKRLLDEDNLCEKYHVDLCRYCGALPGDEAGTAKIEVSQEKVGSKDKEFTRIEIYTL